MNKAPKLPFINPLHVNLRLMPQGPKNELHKAKQMMKAFGVDPTRKPKQGSAIAREVKESDRYGPPLQSAL